MPFIDFGALKERVSMEQAVQLLGLQLRPQGHQLRGTCPNCGARHISPFESDDAEEDNIVEVRT